MQKSFFTFAVMLFVIMSITILNAQNTGVQEKYSQVRILSTTQSDFYRINAVGLFFDGGVMKKGEYFETLLSESEIALLNKSGVPYQVTIEDWAAYYNGLPKMSEMDIQSALKYSKDKYAVSHSIYGTMGGHLKVEEINAKLDSLRLQYPTLVSVKWSLGNTYEGRPMNTVRITKNPDVPTGRPEIWFNGVTHAREPLGMENVLYYVYWLVENYNIDPIATYILNNREIYWTPIINVDGYYHNQTTNPTGGGQWRANMHVTTGSCGYVDLNRNFGTYNFWNSSNGGSSTDACSGGSGTYRGPSPMSEPETQNWRTFVNSRNFRVEMDYHTYGNYLIKPYAWCDPTPTPDDAIFNEYGSDIVAVNHFSYGTPTQTVGYAVRGGSTDWDYSTDSTGHTRHIMAFSPEVGVISFWPPQANILPEAQTCFEMNKYVTLVSGPYTGLKSATFNKNQYVQNETGNCKVVFRDKGLLDAQNVKVTFTPVTSYLTIPTQVYTRVSLPSMVSDSTTFNFTIAAACPNNSVVIARLKIMQNDTVTMYDQNYNIFVGTGYTVLADSAENGTSNWPTMTNWSIVTTKYLSPAHSFKGICTNSGVNQMVSIPLNLSTYPAVYLSWYQKYALETGYDFGYVDVSSNNGTSWSRLATYNGVDSATWKFQSFNITSLVGGSTNMLVRFRDSCDANTNYDGWYVDNIKISAYQVSPLVGINGNVEEPFTYSLAQNYPNPFNPMTNISYSIPKSGMVTLKVYNTLGMEIATLVNEVKQAGNNTITFNAAGLSSGVYFYRIESGDFVDIKKMVLLK